MPKKSSSTPQPVRDSICGGGLLSIAEAAKFLGNVGASTMYRLMTAGELPYTRVASARKIPRSALVEYAERNLVAREGSR